MKKNDACLKEIHPIIFFGLCCALMAILLGFILGGIFGGAEDSLKEWLDRAGTIVLESVYKSDVAAKDLVVKKSWEYFKRAHMHWGAIGSAALTSILALILLCRSARTAQVTVALLGVGSLVYPSFWLCSGIFAPQMGGTDVAKEYFYFLGKPGAAFCILGLGGTLLCVIRDRFAGSNKNAS